MKKIFISLMAPIFLLSCWQKVVEEKTFDQAVSDFQSSLVSHIQTYSDLLNEEEIYKKQNITLSAETTGTNLNMNFISESNSQITGDLNTRASLDLTGELSTDGSNPMSELAFDADVKISANLLQDIKENIMFVNLKEIEMNITGDEMIVNQADFVKSMINGYFGSIYDSWVKIPLNITGNTSLSTEDLILKGKKILPLLSEKLNSKKLFTLINEEEASKEYWNYIVKINSEAVSDIITSIVEEFSDEIGVTADEIKGMETEITTLITDNNLPIHLSISKADSSYFIIELPIEEENLVFQLENTKKSFDFTVKDTTKDFNFLHANVKKGSTNKGTITVQVDSTTIFPEVSFEFSGDIYAYDFSASIEIPKNDITTGNLPFPISITLTATGGLKSLPLSNIQMPEDFTEIEEVLGKFFPETKSSDSMIKEENFDLSSDMEKDIEIAPEETDVSISE